MTTEIHPGLQITKLFWPQGYGLKVNMSLGMLSERVPYIKLLPEELVVISHATVHFFLKLVDGKWRVLPVCAG